jgi:DNA-binding CsgD family transcriptional regulator
VLGLLRALAASGPVLVAVDDVQWLDRPSASALEFAARRLRNEPIGILVARRGILPDVPLGLEQALPREPVRRLLVGPLDGDALERLIHARLDVELGTPAIRQLEASSGGNPYFALELARTLATREDPLQAGEPLPVPGTLRSLIGARLAGLGPEAREVALAASALARPTVGLVEDCVDSANPAAALASAVEAGVLEVDGDRLRFSHPLLASVVYADASVAQRRAVHARIAGAVDEVEERARHLALAADAPDGDIATSLDEAARSVRARGAPGDAALLFEDAERLTPRDDVDAAARRAVDAAECNFEGGDFGRVRALLEPVAESDSTERARALAFLGWVRAYQEGFAIGAEIFRAALEAVGPDLAQRIEIERGLAWSLHELGQLEEASVHSHAAFAMARELAEPGVLARAMADLAFNDVVTGRADALERIESALALDESAEWQTVVGRPRWIYAMILEWRGELDAARTAFDELYRAALDRGDEHSVPYILFHLARVELLMGRPESARALAGRAHDATVETGQESERPFGLTIVALVQAHLGEVGATRETTDSGMSVARQLGVIPAYFELCATRGFLELSLGNYDEADRFLGRLHDEVRRASFVEPSLFRYQGDLIETLVALGRLEEAAARLDELEEIAEAVDHHWARTISARCRGLLLAARGETSKALESLQRALELHDTLAQPLELARTHLVDGAVRRRSRQKRAARESIQSALDLFEGLGARLWVDRARADLARIGGRAPADDALTPTEQRVAELVAAGGTYREVADALFMSPKTVQWNLSKVYRKLGIRSRAQLPANLGAGRREPSTPAEPPVPP